MLRSRDHLPLGSFHFRGHGKPESFVEGQLVFEVFNALLSLLGEEWGLVAWSFAHKRFVPRA